MAKRRPARNTRVRMLRDFSYSVDGVTIRSLAKGETYSLSKARAAVYLKKGIAEMDKAIDKVPETKGGKHGSRQQRKR